jgi:putative hemolysin
VVLPIGGDDAEPTPLELRVTELDGRRAARFAVHRVDGGDLLALAE